MILPLSFILDEFLDAGHKCSLVWKLMLVSLTLLMIDYFLTAQRQDKIKLERFMRTQYT